MKDLVIIGAGYGLQEVCGLVNDINAVGDKYKIVAALDDNLELKGKKMGGVVVEGTLEDAKKYYGAQYVFCIGTKKTRKKRKELIERIGVPVENFESLIHPRAKVYESAKVGHGCLVYCGSAVYYNAVIGDFSVVSTNTVIANEAFIDEFVLVGNGCVILNRVHIESNCFVGSGVNINDDVRVGEGAVLGIGSVVLEDVPHNMLAFGNPARVMRAFD